MIVVYSNAVGNGNVELDKPDYKLCLHTSINKSWTALYLWTLNNRYIMPKPIIWHLRYTLIFISWLSYNLPFLIEWEVTFYPLYETILLYMQSIIM